MSKQGSHRTASRAKSKSRLALKETQAKEGLFAKEMIERKFKNRKVELEESTLAQEALLTEIRDLLRERK